MMTRGGGAGVEATVLQPRPAQHQPRHGGQVPPLLGEQEAAWVRGQVQRPPEDIPGEVGGGCGVSVPRHTLETDRGPGPGVEDGGAEDGHTGPRGRAGVRGNQGRHGVILRTGHLTTQTQTLVLLPTHVETFQFHALMAQ